MLFHSQAFILGFLPACLAGCFLLGRFAGRTWAMAWLLAASLFFYGWWNPPFVAAVARLDRRELRSSAERILRLARADRSTAARRWLIAGIAGNLGLLGWFKYADFLLHDRRPGAAPLGIFLPLAISFFTFQQIMFLVDSARQERADTDLLTYATFVAFFPHLIAGPIVRPKDIIPQLQQRDLADAARRKPRRGPDAVLARPGQEAGAGRHVRRLRRYRLQRRRERRQPEPVRGMVRRARL